MKITEKIASIKKLYAAKGCSAKEIEVAQQKLGIVFPAEYADYLQKFGVISFYATEWTGLGVEGNTNVVEATLKERQLDEKFPADCFLLENLCVDGLLVIVNGDGQVFQFQHGNKRKICNSLSEYLDMCMQRAE